MVTRTSRLRVSCIGGYGLFQAVATAFTYCDARCTFQGILDAGRSFLLFRQVVCFVYIGLIVINMNHSSLPNRVISLRCIFGWSHC